MCWSCQGNKVLPSRIKVRRYPKYPPLLIVLRQLLSESFCLSWGDSTWLRARACVCEREREKERECQEVREREESRESAREWGREKIERERESWASDGRNDSEGDLQASRLAASSRRWVLQGDFPWLQYRVVHWLLASSLWVPSTHLCEKQTNNF
jgi:hypothetical protein